MDIKLAGQKLKCLLILFTVCSSPSGMFDDFNGRGDMINNVGIGNARNILTFIGQANRALSLKAGSVIKAQVQDVKDNGNALIRILTTGGGQENKQNTVIKAFSEIPLAKGQTIYLEVLDNKDSIQMRFIGESGGQANSAKQNIPAKFLELLANLSDSKLNNSDIKTLIHMLKSLPEHIRTAVPEFRSLENFLMDANQLTGKQLKAFIESSGVAFETKLKIAVMNDPGSVFQSLAALQSEGDLKALLLRLKKMAKNQNFINALKESGLKPAEISSLADRMIRNIEFFQLSSKINDMFHTFLPVMWDSLKDGEFIFKKGSHNSKNSYTCDINLDLDPLGRLSISVTTVDKGFYITLHAERPETQSLISSSRDMLEKRFSAQGLSLKMMNVGQKDEISFGNLHSQGINLKA
jgi:hypothetical protein